MAIVYLIRHGQASFGKADYDQLSDLGQLQSARLGQVLSSRMPVFDTVCLGTMTRHKQTANNCLAGFNTSLDEVDAVYDSGWNEYDHQDILSKYRPEFSSHDSMQTYLREQPNPKKAFEVDFNGAIDRWINSDKPNDYNESWVSFTARVHGALEQVLALTPHSKNIAVFTSGGPISLIAQSLLGIDQVKIMNMNWTLLNGGITKIVSNDSRTFVASLNDHSHFEGEDFKHFFTYT